MITGECKIILILGTSNMKHEEETDKPDKVRIAVTSQHTDDRYNLEAKKKKAEKMGVSLRILRLFE